MLGTIIKIALIAAAFIFIAILIIKRFCYFQPSYEFAEPLANFEDIREGNVHSWFLPGQNGKVILFCHGNAGNISHRQDKVINMNKLGYSVLIFDYTGFGHSKGVPGEESCYRDACIYADLLIKKAGRENVVCYGESLGAAVAAHVALKYNIGILVIESGLPSIKQYMKSKAKVLVVVGFLFPEFNTVEYLRNYRGRSLVMHCPHDEIISWDSTEEMRKLATKVIEMEGSHNSPIVPWKDLNDFLLNQPTINE
jgi:hypothetical protein